MKEPTLFSLVSGNIFRRPFRNGILVICVAAVVGMQIAAALLDRASRQGLELGIERLGADLVAVPRGLSEDLINSYMTGDAAVFYMPRSTEERLKGFDYIEGTSSQLYIESLSGASCCSAWNVFLIGFEPESDFTIKPWLDGRGEIPLGPDDVLAGAGMAMEEGSTVRFYGRTFRVAGVLEPTGAGLDTTVFIPIDTAYLMAKESATKAEQTLSITPESISSVMIRLRPKDEGGLPAYRAAYELEMAIPEISIIQPDDLVNKVKRNLSGTLGKLRTVSYAVWPLTALLIGLIFAMAAGERRREIGILRALGATGSMVFGMMLFESLLVAGAGTLLGLALSTGLVGAFSRLISLTLEVPLYWPRAPDLIMLLLTALFLALLTASLAAFIPSLQAARMEPYEAIRRGEL